MHLRYALLVSTKREAETIHKYEPAIGAAWRSRYRLSVLQTSDDIYQFAVQHATYPNAQDGKGYGDAIYGEKYSIQNLTSFEALQTYLEDRAMTIDGWEPVEEGESRCVAG